MKNKKRFYVVMCSFMLIVMTACMGIAQSSQDAERVRVQEVIDHAAKTPEEFMQRVKTVWSNPEAKITEACKIMMGVPLELFNRMRYPADNEKTIRYIIDIEPQINPLVPYK
jgi:hypothetical protein